MLKACWDCIAGDRTHAEEAYGTNLNGVTHQAPSTQAPPWPNPQLERENMFLLPKQLNLDDIITISGNFLSDPKIMRIAFITGYNTPDYQNIACQMDVSFPTNNGKNKIALKIINNGYDEVVSDDKAATDYFVDNDFSILFKVREESMDVYVGPSFLGYVPFKHNVVDIRFISVSGDVEKVKKLNFEFS